MSSRFISLFLAAALGASAVHAYTLTGSHWYGSTITMQLQLGAASSALTDGSASWGVAAEDALATWNNQINATRFTVVRDSTAAIAQGNRQNNVFFSNDVYGQAWGSGVLAVTLTFTSGGTQSVECDVLFNKTLSWDSYRGSQRYTSSGAVYDFHRVAMHEFGHVLGLDHPDQAGQSVTAIMNSRISNLDTLAADDITGAQSIYGAAATTVAAPTITTQPSSQSVTAGSNVSFTVAATSSANMAYQWRKDGTAISGATGTTYSINAVTAGAAGGYSVVITNSAGSTTSATATLTVTTPTTPPAITSAPASQTASPGSSVKFSVTATGTAPLSYSWRKNGTAINGATTASYTINSVQGSDAGTYTVVVGNSAGTVTSAGATLTVTSAPVFTAQPASKSVTAGTATSFSVAVSGSPAPTLQWLKDGTALSGATGSTLSIAAAKASDAGTYTVRATNVSGTATSSGAVLTVATPPVVNTPPSTQTVSVGNAITLGVTASGTPAPTYQWQKNGSNIAGATQSSYIIGSATPADGGTYSVVVSNSAGSTTTVPVMVTVNFSQLVNLSTRGYVGPGAALTAGFVLRGPSDKTVIVRGIGPTLNTFGVTNPLSDPNLVIQNQNTAQTLAFNDSWSVVPQLSTDFQAVGAFPLPSGSADSASEIRLSPGLYSTRVTGDVTTTSGVALVEVYDAQSANFQTRLVNLSTLGYTGSGDGALVAGFSIQGNAPKRVLIRAIGPGLAPYGVSDRLADPRLDVYPLGSTSPAVGNDNWGGTTTLKTAFAAVNAFSLADSSTDAAVVASLDPGVYSVVVSGVNGSTGNVLVEIYDLDP